MMKTVPILLGTMFLVCAPVANASMFINSYRFTDPQYGIIAYEDVVLTIGANDTVATANLSNITSVTGSVPFASWRGNSTPNANIQTPGYFQPMVEIYDNAGTPAVRVTRAGFGNMSLYVAVSIIQFDPTKVRVQRVSSTSLGTSNHTITAVDQSKTFVVPYSKNNFTGQFGPSFSIRAYLTSNTNLRILRGTESTGGSGQVEVYIVEDIDDGNVFTVNARNFSSSAVSQDIVATSENVHVTVVSPDDSTKFMVIGSNEDLSQTSSGGYRFGAIGRFNGAGSTGQARPMLNSGVSYAGTIYEIQWVTPAVEKVLWGFTGQTTPFTGATSNITLTNSGTYDSTKSIVINPSQGHMGTGLVESTNNDAKPRNAMSIEKVAGSASTKVLVTPSTGSPTYYSWAFAQVIQFAF